MTDQDNEDKWIEGYVGSNATREQKGAARSVHMAQHTDDGPIFPTQRGRKMIEMDVERSRQTLGSDVVDKMIADHKAETPHKRNHPKRRQQP